VISGIRKAVTPSSTMHFESKPNKLTTSLERLVTLPIPKESSLVSFSIIHTVSFSFKIFITSLNVSTFSNPCGKTGVIFSLL